MYVVGSSKWMFIFSCRKLPKHVREAQLKAGIKELDCLIARKQV
jgi:hypothetical protein